MNTKRRNFIKSVAVLAAASPYAKLNKWYEEDFFSYSSKYMSVKSSKSYPQFLSLSIDSLGKGKEQPNPLIRSNKNDVVYKIKISGNTLSYFKKSDTNNDKELWSFSFTDKSISIISQFDSDSYPFEILIDQKINYTTVLGIIPEANRVNLPCLIHIPGMGTIRVSCDNKNVQLHYDAKRSIEEPEKNKLVQIIFPFANSAQKKISYNLEIVSIHPALKEIENNSLYDGFRRNFINIFQVNPRLKVLANNSSSDPCALTLYMSAEVAKHTPPLADGLHAMDLIRMTLDRYLNGMKSYGMVGYTDNYENADAIGWHSGYDTLDTYPSLLLAASYYAENTNNTQWLKENLRQLLSWYDIIIKKDIDGDGLVEYEYSGNYGSWAGNAAQRPANWWDTIGFGHKDAYSNAIAYKALKSFGDLLKANGHAEGTEVLEKAAKLKAVYYQTFYNPATGVLGGWRSADGNLHDYYFTFVNGIAITYNLLSAEQENGVMDKILYKMQEVGFTDFSLGLPGNLIPIKKGDYTHLVHRWGGPSLEDGSDSFQIYENGGATACHSYFTVKALQTLNRKADAEKIFKPIMQSMSEGNFSGSCKNKMSKDWKAWDGTCWGYEGFLCDAYLFFLTAI